MIGRVVAIVQARMGSTRLPGKVLMGIGGRPMLDRVVRRASRARLVDHVLIATTDHSHDDVIVRAAAALGTDVFRGSEHDVLDRYHNAAVAAAADTVVRITADCPLIDPKVIDRVVAAFAAAAPEVDLVSNTVRRTFPHGLDVEVVSADLLERLSRDVPAGYHRAHVTSYVHEPGNDFRISSVEQENDHAHLRWTVDEAEDMALVRGIYQHFDNEDSFSWQQAAAYMTERPELMNLNAHVRQRPVHEG